MRREDEISEEDRERVARVINSGIHSVERKPFRPLYMMLMVLAVMTALSVLSVVIEKMYIP
jgi:hypothetical protein